MAVARARYSDFTIAKATRLKLNKRYRNIADKIDILRNSKQFEKGTSWKRNLQSEANSKLL